MTCAEAVRLYLLTLTPVSALVSTRIWTWQLPQSARIPAIVIQQISDIQQPHLRGTDGLKWARLQIDVVANTMAEARAVDQAVMGEYATGSPNGPTGIRGAVFDTGSPPVYVRQVVTDSYRETFDAEEINQARVTRDYRVWYVN